MAPINTTARRGNGDTKDFVILPSDTYRMKIIKATIEENRFADPLPDGTKPLQLVLNWEVTTLTEEQSEAMADAEEDWDSAQVWQRLNPYYGPVRDGGVSRFQQFIDGLRVQGQLADFNPELFDPESLVGIEQKVVVEQYFKTMGDNAGKLGNKVLNVQPLTRPRKNGKTDERPSRAITEDAIENLPF